VPAVVNTVDASTHRTSRVFRVLRRARVVTRAASTGGVWQWWPSADAWADDAGSDAVHSTTDVSTDGGEIEAAASDRVNFGHDNPWRTVALILGAMLVAALVHPPLASASSTLIASITANVVTPAILVGSYPAVSYLVAGVNAWATNAVGVAATLVSSAASAGAGYAAASARARVEMDALRTEIAHIKRDVAASFGAVVPGVQSAVVDAGAGAGVGTAASASTVEDANVNAAAATASVTEDPPAVDAERRARVEAELADLRRQLARLRAVWTPEADQDVDDAGAENADGTDVGGGSSPAVAVDVTGDVDWGAVAKSRALWSPGADDSSGAETSSSSPAAPGASAGETDGTIVVGAAAMDEDTAARIAAELAALKLELAGVRASTTADHSSVPAGETDADAAGGETAGPGVGGSGPGSGSVDWAALAKSRAVWSPSDDNGDGTEVDVVGVASSDGSTALGSSAEAAVASEDAERSRLLEEDLMWRRRMGMRENAQDDQPLGH
jgi:ribosomal protein L29